MRWVSTNVLTHALISAINSSLELPFFRQRKRNHHPVLCQSRRLKMNGPCVLRLERWGQTEESSTEAASSLKINNRYRTHLSLLVHPRPVERSRILGDMGRDTCRLEFPYIGVQECVDPREEIVDCEELTMRSSDRHEPVVREAIEGKLDMINWCTEGRLSNVDTVSIR